MFSERLKFILDSTNISQVQLAKELNLTAPAINRWCNNVTEPDNTTLVKIAKFLNVSTDYLLGNDNLENVQDTKFRELESLKKALQKSGFMSGDEDLTDEELDKVMKFVSVNKEFLKGNK